MAHKDAKKPAKAKDGASSAAQNAREDAARSQSSRASLGPRARIALAVAALVALAGGGLWAYAATTAPPPPPETVAAASDDGPAAPGSSLQPDSLAPGATGDSGLPDWLPDLPGADDGSDQPADPDAPPPDQPDSDTQRLIDDLSPAIFTLGFSFMVAFAIGYAVRTFVKISLIAIGAFLLALFGLDYAGVITINMTALEGHYDSFTAFLSREFESFRSFITGYLPSTASGAAGLVFGFRRK